jgi:hypothetical protein
LPSGVLQHEEVVFRVVGRAMPLRPWPQQSLDLTLPVLCGCREPGGDYWSPYVLLPDLLEREAGGASSRWVSENDPKPPSGGLSFARDGGPSKVVRIFSFRDRAPAYTGEKGPKNRRARASRRMERVAKFATGKGEAPQSPRRERLRVENEKVERRREEDEGPGPTRREWQMG